MRGGVSVIGARTRQARQALRTAAFTQTAIFTVSNVLVGLMGGVVKAILATRLSVAAFGGYAFANSFLPFLALFFEFGLFLPAARLVARSNLDARHEIIGAALCVFVPVGLAFGFFVFGSSFVVDEWFHVNVAGALRLVAPIALVYPFFFVGIQLSQGVERLHVSSITAAGGQALFLVGLLAIIAIGLPITLSGALVIRTVSLLIAALFLAAWLKPVFRNIGTHARTLIRGAREYGMSVYVGRVLAIGSYNMDVLMLAALTNARQVAIYALAGAVAAAVGLPVVGLANALFGRMARTPQLDRRWLSIAWVVGLAGAGAAWLGAAIILPAVFGHVYGAAVGLVPILGLAQAIRGVTGIYNSFLAAQALGRDLRNAATVLTLSNIIFNFLLIPPFAAVGAAWASVLALVGNLAAHVWAYRRYSKLQVNTAMDVG
jgi:O-antigen/teichoic acid export membrane protein